MCFKVNIFRFPLTFECAILMDFILHNPVSFLAFFLIIGKVETTYGNLMKYERICMFSLLYSLCESKCNSNQMWFPAQPTLKSKCIVFKSIEYKGRIPLFAKRISCFFFRTVYRMSKAFYSFVLKLHSHVLRNVCVYSSITMEIAFVIKTSIESSEKNRQYANSIEEFQLKIENLKGKCWMDEWYWSFTFKWFFGMHRAYCIHIQHGNWIEN